MKKLFFIAFAYFAFMAMPFSAFALSLDFSTQIKNLSTGEGFLSTNVTINPGDDIMILYQITNNSGETAQNFTLAPSDLLNGEINAYLGDTAKTFYLNSFYGPANFQVHTNTQSQQNFSYGNLTTGSSLFIYVPFRIPSTYNTASTSFTLTPSCTNTCTIAGSATRTFNVGVSPSFTAASFANAVINDASNSTAVSATVTDPAGVSDVSSVRVNLTSIGGSSSFTLYDDGAHGDGASGDGVFRNTGISTTVAAGNYSLTFTATDSNGNTGTTTATLTVQSAGSPVVSKNSQDLTTVSSVSGYTSATINWQSTLNCGGSASQGYKIVNGGTAGDPTTGTTILDWQASGCTAGVARNNSIAASSLNTGSNTIYIYVKTSDNYVGYLTTTITKDTTAPTITINGYSSSVLGTADGTVSWYASEAGTYTVRVGGTSGNSTSGTQVTGTNASGTYTSANASASALIASQFLNANLSEGANTLFVHFTDAGGNVSSSSITATKDSTPPVSAPSSVTLSDADFTYAGIDGRDFSLSWTEPTDTSHISEYRLYIYKSTASYASGDTIIATLPVGTTSYTSLSSVTTDSKGTAFSAGTYRIAVFSVGSGAYENSAITYSGNVTIEYESSNPPAFVSAQFVSGNRLKITFDRSLSTNLTDHNTAKISSADFTVNTALGTNGIEQVSGASVFVYINALNNTGATSSDLDFSATYQEDSVSPASYDKPITAGFVLSANGVLGPVASRGSFTSGVAIANGAVNVAGNVSNQSITDGQAPNPLTITAPANNTKTSSSSLSFQYTLPEVMNASTVKLKFTRTGGAADSLSPHTITLSSATAGSHSQTINLLSFTSSERGASDTLANESIYTLELSGSDTAGNTATTVSATGFMYDSIAPALVTLQRFPSGAPSNNYWTTNNTPLLQWSASTDTNGISSYLVEVSTQSNFSVSSATTSTSSTSWQISSALGDSAYYWRVRAYDPAGNVSSAQSTVEGFIVDTTGPTTSVNSTLSTQTTSALTVTVASATDGTGVGNNLNGYRYNLFRADSNCSSNSILSGYGTGTSFAFTALPANTTYCFKVQAKDGLDNVGSYSATRTFSTLANQVTGLSGASSYTTDHAVTLSWTNQGQSGVKIEQDSGCDGTYETTPLDNTAYLSASKVISTGLSPNTCYQFRVDSYNASGNLNGASRPTTQVTTLPALPLNLNNNTNTTSSVTFDWDDVTGATSYKVYNTDNAGNNATLIASPATSTYNKTGLAANAQYCIKVTAVSAVGEGPATSFACAYSSANIPLNLTTSAKTTSTITWSWQTGGAESAFYAFTNTPVANSGWTALTSWLQSSLSANTSYQCFVKARNADGDETSTINTTVYSAIEDPALTIGTITSTSIQAQTTVSNLGGTSAVFFENSTLPANSGWITTSSWNNTSLTSNTPYIFKVKARNGDAVETSFSGTTTVYTYAAVPVLVVGESVTDTTVSIRINTNGNPDGTQYQIYRSTTGAGTPTTNAGAWIQVQDFTAHNNGDSFFDTGLTAGTTYFYTARAQNNAGTPVQTAWSSNQSIVTDTSSQKISETAGITQNSWYNGASLNPVFHINSVTGIAYYRYRFDTVSNTNLDSDASCTDTTDATIKKWGDGGTIPDMTTDLNGNITTTGIYYLHFVACTSGNDTIPGNSDDVRANSGTYPQINFGPYKFDNTIPTISDNYPVDGVLSAASQSVTFSPADTDSGVSEMRYCIDDSSNNCDPFVDGVVLLSPYQFTYTTSVDQYIRYQSKDVAGNFSTIDGYHVMIDANAPIIQTVTAKQTSGTLLTPNDTIYKAGDTVRVAVAESNTETGLTATVQITSVSASYNSGVQALAYDGVNNVYYYDWNTSGRTQASDYTITVTLTDSVSNADSDNGTVVQLDNTVPTVTAFAFADTTSASTTYTNSRNITVSSFTGTDANSSVSYYKVFDATGDVSAPSVNDTDFSLTSAPNTYALVGNEGVVSVFAWVMDAANNIATASKQTITLDLTNPAFTAFTVADASSASTGYTNNALINVASFTVTDATPITKYLLTQTSSTPTVATMNSSGSGTAPTTFTITGGEGAKTIYAWAMDAAENIGSTSWLINYDITPPTITSVQYLDNDTDGQIDRVKIRFSESVANTSSVTNGTGMTVAGHAITSGSGVLSSTSVASDTLTLTLDETGIETAIMPDFTYAAASGNIQDLAENMLANVLSGTIIESDGVAPVKTGVTMEDSNTNGKIDRIVVSYSETLQALTNDAANWTLANIPSNGSKGAVTVTAGTSNIIIAISEGVGAEDTAASTLTVAYPSAGTVMDAAGNTALSFSALAPTDAAKPVFITKETQDLDANGKIDAVKLILSESISDITITASNFALSAGNSRSINAAYSGSFGGLTFTNGVSTGSTSDDALFYLKLSEGTLVDTGDRPTITYTAGTLKELASSAQNVATTSALTLADKAVPVITSVTVKDTNSDGAIDTAEIIFSENVDDSTLSVAGWSIGGSSATTFSTTVQGDADVDDDRFAVSLTSGVSGTDLSSGDVTYSSVAGGLQDHYANLLADRVTADSPTEIDKAAPVILSAVYSDNGTLGTVTDDTITITFSEDVSDATLNMTAGNSDIDFTVANGGSIANATTSTGTSANDDRVIVTLGSGDTALTSAQSTVALILSAVSDLASTPNTSTSVSAITTNGAIIINEIMWGGTSDTTTNDEYIELRNLSSTAVDFSVTNHVLYVNGSFWAFLSSGTIPGNGFFLISRYDVNDGALTHLTLDSSALNHDRNTGLSAIPNSSLQVKLYQGVDNTGVLLDTADDGAGTPFAGVASSGNYRSMERNDAPGNGVVAGSWHTSDGSLNLSSTSIYGTPKTSNVRDSQAPSFTLSPDSRTPVPNTLRPDDQPTISVDFSDNSGGSGIDTSNVKLYLDLDQNLSTSATVGSTTLTGCETDKTSSTTISSTSALLIPSSPLPHGRYRACVLITDVAGNTASTSWDFWIDHFTMTITEVSLANVWVTGGVPAESADDVTKITLTTYGAGIDLSANFPLLTSGGNTIAKSNVFYDSVLQKKIGSGSFVQQHGYNGYLNTNSNTLVESISAETDLQTNGSLKTYDIYVKYQVDVTTVQPAGVYKQAVPYSVQLTY